MKAAHPGLDTSPPNTPPPNTPPPNTGGLPPEALGQIRQVLSATPNVLRAWLFGSRALGRHRPSSDIDIAVEGPLDDQELAELRAALEALPLIWRFDVVGLDRLRHEALGAHVARAGVQLYPHNHPPITAATAPGRSSCT